MDHPILPWRAKLLRRLAQLRDEPRARPSDFDEGLDFGKMVAEALAERGLTLETQEEHTGVPTATVTQWLSGQAPSELSELRRFCHALGLYLPRWAWKAGLKIEEWSPAEYLLSGLAAIAHLHPARLVPIPDIPKDVDYLTYQQASSILDDLEYKARHGLLPLLPLPDERGRYPPALSEDEDDG